LGLTDIVKRSTATRTKTERLRCASPAITICLAKLHVGRHLFFVMTATFLCAVCRQCTAVFCFLCPLCTVYPSM